jgi:filamentous hemagglutinin family protein
MVVFAPRSCRLWLLTYLVILLGFPRLVRAQAIVPANDGTGSVVRQAGDRFDISGGQTSRDGANLFHSLQRFGLSRQEIANFLTNPSTRNIFTRVTGNEVSFINGLLQVSGSKASLFLINPNGILLGPDVRLNLAGAFTATTATGIGFSNGEFNTIGNANTADLFGEPTSFIFALNQPGPIGN